MQKFLFLQATWLWDRIAALPYLLEKKQEKNIKIYILDFGKWYKYQMNKPIINILKKHNLFDELLIVPYNKIKLAFFLIRYFLYFDKIYIPVKSSKKLVFLWKLLWKKIDYTFNSLNDDTNYNNVADWMFWKEINSLYKLLAKKIEFPYDTSYVDKFKLTFSFSLIFVWPYSRSLTYETREKIFQYLQKSNLKIVLVWSSNKERESWIYNHLSNDLIQSYNIIDLIWKTDFDELCSIIKDAKLCICANWWIMWLSHTLNKNVVSFSTCSGLITHPPFDDKTQFHIFKKTECIPCEQNWSEELLIWKWFDKCIFYQTCREAICKDNINYEIIKLCLDKILNL